MDLDRYNQLSADEARALARTCLDVPRWVDEVVDGRPYAGLEALRAQADASARELTDGEVATALAQHPRIGERHDDADPQTAFSHREQAGVADDDATAERLAAANAAYERRFGHVFLVRAAGRSGPQILAELRRRIDNDPATERTEVVAALREISLRRLDQVVVG